MLVIGGETELSCRDFPSLGQPVSEDFKQFHVVPWLYWPLLPIHRLFDYLYFKSITIEGREYLPAHGPVVLAVKHFSRWDPMILGLVSREPLYFMTNANQFSGIQGWLIQRLGAFPVDLTRPHKSSLRHAIALLHQSKKLVIFPEGGIVRDQPVRDLKPGLVRLVLQAEGSAPAQSIPVVPIGLHYQPDAQRWATVKIQIGPPLYSHDYRQEQTRATADAMTQALQAALLKMMAA